MGNASNARLARSARLAWAGGPAELCARVTHGIISWHGKRLKRSPRTFRAARVGRRGRLDMGPRNPRGYIVGCDPAQTVTPRDPIAPPVPAAAPCAAPLRHPGRPHG